MSAKDCIYCKHIKEKVKNHLVSWYCLRFEIDVSIIVASINDAFTDCLSYEIGIEFYKERLKEFIDGN